ncbi:MAG TPA: glycerate kinase [Micromonosporaceae bacterium]|nr:glycerate kinase [Micromonosporaceae bacterium]HCU49513.1 glycerate kinase [Micromonosporaceae bacterium]
MLVAPDKFKGSLTAKQVAEHVIAGLRQAQPDLRYIALPVADGGDGTVDAAVAAGFRRIERVVTGPTGVPIVAAFAIRLDTAIVELAQASGLNRLPKGGTAPLTASTEGTGELIRTAVSMGCRRIVLGLGGSASTDGGSGMLRALGVRLLGAHGRDLPPGGAALRRLDRLDLSGFSLGDFELVVASDVDNPLSEAAGEYGPQKGASAAEVQILEQGLARWAEIVEWELGVGAQHLPGAGAAGGVGFAALAFLGATVQSGIELLLDLLGFADRLPGARLVVTGEGSLDAQTLRGKAVAGVAAAASRSGVPVVAVAGRIELSQERLREAGLAGAYALSEVEPDAERSMRNAGKLLERLAARIELPC